MSSDTLKYGTVVLEFNTDSALAIVNNQFDESFFINSGDSIKVKTGDASIKLSVIHDYVFEEIFDLKEDSIITVQHEFEFLPLNPVILDGNIAARKYFNANLLVISDENSDIFLNDSLVGNEFVYLNVPIGSNKVKVENVDTFKSLYIINSTNITSSDNYFRVVERHIKPLEKTSKSLAFLPGFSQSYKYQYNKANLIRISMAATFLSLSSLTVKYQIDKKKYNDIASDYKSSINSAEATRLGNSLAEKNKTLNNLATYRNTAFFTFLGVYVYNVIDGLISKPKIGYRTKKPFNFYLNSDSQNNLSMNIKIELRN